MAGILESAGAQSKKGTAWGSLFVESLWEGLYTNRAALHSSGSLYEQRYLGGRPGSLIGGLNTEISVRNTLIRRPGLSSFSTFVYPTAPNVGYAFPLTDGSIRVIIDTGSTGALTLSAAGAASGTSTTYTGTFPNGGSNAYVGYEFTIAGFTNAGNNGTFIVTASSTTTLTVTNAQGVAESHAATATSAGAVYWDEQNGSAQLLFGKGAGAGQTGFVAVGGILYMGDGVDTRKWTPLNPNLNGTVSVWNWGIVAPVNPPTITTVESGSASIPWTASTVWSTMGLLNDAANNAVYQLNSFNIDSNITDQLGSTGSGQPNWKQTPGATTSDNSITWTNLGPVVLRTPNMPVSNATGGGTVAAPAFVYDPVTKAVYFNAAPGLASGKTGAAATISFKAGVGQSVHDGDAKWFYLGPGGLPKLWQTGHSYPAYGSVANNDVVSTIIEPTDLSNGLPSNQTLYIQGSSGGTSAGSATSPFNASTDVSTTTTIDGDLVWLSLGTDLWAANTGVFAWFANGSVFNVVKDANGNFQVCITSGTTATKIPGSTYTLTAASTTGTTTTYSYATTTAVPVGTAQFPVNIVVSGFTNSGNNGTFQVISSTSTSVTVASTTGVNEVHAGSAVYNPWGTTYGDPTNDGTAQWTCVGTAMTWAANTQWFLPSSGFQPPSTSNAFGGASVIDSNTNVEFVINSGKGGSSAPSWNTDSGGTFADSSTTDGAATWYNLEPFSAPSLSWKKGYAYAYSYKSLAFDDFYAALPLGGGNTPPGLVGPPNNITWTGVPSGSATEAISTASPAALITTANAGAVNTIQGVGSLDPQVDTIVIWRSLDGGGSSQMFELTEIPAPKPIGGIAQPWTFKDFLPDLATAQYPGLNTNIPAPIDESNDPPPSTYIPMDYNFQRIWGADGTAVPFSGGPDVVTGNPNEAFAPADNMPFLAPVKRVVKIPAGNVVFTTSSIELIAGGPLTSSFYSVTIGPGIGLSSFNALDIFAGEIFFMDASSTIRVVSPSLSVTTAGFPVADQLKLFNPATAYVTYADLPNDAAIYIGTGSTTYGGNTGWFRMNPRQIPGGINGPEPVFSPFAAITGGCQMVQALEVSPGVRQLLVGPAAAGSISKRDSSVFTDNGTPYNAFATLGSLFLAHRGELAIMRFIECDFAQVTTNPTVSFLLNEISGSFTNFVTANQPFDPPSLYGGRVSSPASYNPIRFYFGSVQTVARCVHGQFGISFGTTSNADECFNLTINGAIVKNK